MAVDRLIERNLMETKTIHRCKSKAIRWFGYPDIHFPDQDPEALAVAEAAQRSFDPDCVITGNDLLNCTPFSRYPKQTIEDGAIVDFKATELVPANAFIDRVQAHTGHTYFLEGNHDAWLERWTANQGHAAMALHSLTSVKSNLSLGRKDFTYIRQLSSKHDRTSSIQLHPKLICVHDWCATKYAAGWHREKSPFQSVIFNHTHRMQSDTLTYPCSDMPTTAMSAGCLCNRIPMYGHTGSPTGWTHGFWVAYVGCDDFTLYSVPINKGRTILPSGKEVKIV